MLCSVNVSRIYNLRLGLVGYVKRTLVVAGDVVLVLVFMGFLDAGFELKCGDSQSHVLIIRNRVVLLCNMLAMITENTVL